MSRWEDWSDAKNWAMGILASLLVAAVLGSMSWLLREPAGVPDQRVDFLATSHPDFAIQSEFEGTAVVEGNRLRVSVERAEISYRPTNGGYESPRTIVDLRVSLVEPFEDTWTVVRQSPLLEIGRELRPGSAVAPEPFDLALSLRELVSISHTWLMFEVNEADPESSEVGSSHAHARDGLFSD